MQDDPHTHNSSDAFTCIGLDIAWFGGSKGDRDSQYDFLAAVHIQGSEAAAPAFTRVPLPERDPQATHVLSALDALLTEMPPAGQTVLALDAPIQSTARPHLGPRTPKLHKGSVVRRACENALSQRRQQIDRADGGSRGWQPNIQPGAPLAPRVVALLEGLEARGFVRWTRAAQDAPKLVIECFPAEAIWAMKRQGHYPPAFTAAGVKTYKKQRRQQLTEAQVTHLVRRVLDAFAGCHPSWPALVEDAIAWSLADPTWQTDDGTYRGGKLLDDLVDTMIALATALSYAQRKAHVWQDPQHSADGHIIGPGCPMADERWDAAYQDTALISP